VIDQRAQGEQGFAAEVVELAAQLGRAAGAEQLGAPADRA
jgi:hypothetical protein